MIALADNLPLVQLPDQRAVHFERAWLERAVTSAAESVGYNRWWLASHVTESVVAYLEHEFNGTIIASQGLRTLVASVLRVIGYPDVARNFHLPEPTVRISLMALADAAGAGFELAFFQELDQTIHKALASRTARVELCGLTDCVKRLRRTRIWRKDCRELRNEIVAHIRGHIANLEWRNHFELELT